MKRPYLLTIAFALIAVVFPPWVLAQESSISPIALQAAPAISEPNAVKHAQPILMVMGFESGTVSAQVSSQRGFLFKRRDGESYDPSQLGIGVADMLIEQLLATGQFRLIERKADAAGSGADFIVTGSVTKFGFEDRNVGGIVANVATMGMLGYKQSKTQVALTARVINAATGQIVASMSADGASGKGGGLRVFGMGSNGAGGGDISSSNFRSTAIGQATGRAVANLAKKIVEQKSSF